MKDKIEAIIIFFSVVLVLLLSSIIIVNAIPPVAAEFHGWVIVEGRFAPRGTIISVYDQDGTLCGQTEVRENGEYGLLSCAGDDPSTDIDEGASDNEGLSFYVYDRKINTEDSIKWNPGTIRPVNLIIGDVNKARPLLEEPSFISIFERNYLFVLLIVLFITLIALAGVIKRVRKGIKRIQKELEDLEIDEL